MDSSPEILYSLFCKLKFREKKLKKTNIMQSVALAYGLYANIFL